MTCANPDIIRIGIDVDSFKNLFKRGFEYLPDYSAVVTYNAGDIVYYNNLFYSCNTNGTLAQLPTDVAFWTEALGLSVADYIEDDDIENAFDEACMKFRSSLFKNDQEITLGYLYLTAHFLVGDLNAGGSNGGSNAGIVSSKSVGSVSEGYVIPAWMQKPQYSFYATSYYGRKYVNMIYSRTRGNMAAVWSGTNA